MSRHDQLPYLMIMIIGAWSRVNIEHVCTTVAPHFSGATVSHRPLPQTLHEGLPRLPPMAPTPRRYSYRAHHACRYRCSRHRLMTSASATGVNNFRRI